MRPNDGWTGVKNILVDEAKDVVKGPKEFISNAIQATQEKTKELEV